MPLVLLSGCGDATHALPAPGSSSPPRGKLEATPAKGPYPSLAAFCEAFLRDIEAQGNYPLDGDAACDPDAPGLSDQGVVAAKAASGPILEAKLFRTHSRYDRPNEVDMPIDTALLAIRTVEGWFVAPTDAVHGSFQVITVLTRGAELALRDVLPGGAPELIFRYRKEYIAGSRDETAPAQIGVEERLMLCGVGGSGRPSCVDLLTGASEEVEQQGSPRRVEQRSELLASFGSDAITLNPAPGAIGGPASNLPAPGTYRFVFP